MIRDKIIVENDRWVNYYASILQECWRHEIEAAIEQVKREIPVIKRKPRRRKRGYWTPTGFAWFKCLVACRTAACNKRSHRFGRDTEDTCQRSRRR